jgi:Bacterial Ig-like domain (group 3)/FG-GAP-like repeat
MPLRLHPFSWFSALFLLLTLSGSVVAQNPFNLLLPNATGATPTQVAVGDFNEDGIPDMAVTASADNAIDIFLGKGDGNFASARRVPVSTSTPVALVEGDFNHDGHLDLAVLNSPPGAQGSVSILLGQGSGLFSLFKTYSVGNGPTALAVADFDGDSNLDLAVVVSNQQGGSSIPGVVTILLGQSDGSFQAQSTLYSIGLNAQSIAIGDFNGDGRPDLAVVSGTGSQQNQVSIFLNEGAGTFQSIAGVPVSASGVLTSIAAADFDGDGNQDLAFTLANNSASSLLVYGGAGNGSFHLISTLFPGQNPSWVVAGDVNGDGRPDLMVANSTDSTVSTFLNNGSGTFQAQTIVSVGATPAALALADLNADGKPDLAVVNEGEATAQVLRGSGDGAFRPGSYTMSSTPVSVTHGDFNRDGFADLAVLTADNTVTVLLNDQRGGFRRLPAFPGCNNISSTAVHIIAGDFDKDGIPDLAVGCNSVPSENGSSTLVTELSGNGDGTFVMPGSVDDYGIWPVIQLLPIDLKEDGFPTPVALISETGLFSFDGSLSESFVTGAFAGLAAGDFNGDGSPDVIVTDTSYVSKVFLNDGTGSFHELTQLGLGGYNPLAGDFNGDGWLDIISMQGMSLGNGDGTFNLPAFPIPQQAGLAAATADFNGDGVLDVLTLYADGMTNTGTFDLYLGHADGSFTSVGGITTVSGATSYNSIPDLETIADFDGNGSPDLALLSSSGQTVFVLLNKNSFQPSQTVLSQSGNAVVGQPITLSAAVSSQQSSPSGTVAFKLSGVVQTSEALAAGTAQAVLPGQPAAGSYGYTALYTGDGTYGGGLSQRLAVNVGKASTATAIASTSATSKLGQNVTLTASVTPEFSGTPGGTMQFFADGEPIATAALSNGKGSANISSLSEGTHTINAVYSGDVNFIASSATFKQHVGKAASTVSLSSSLNPAVYGQAVTLTAAVTDAAGVMPTGLVVFSSGSTTYGSVALSSGEAQLTLPQLPVGKHSMKAQYAGDAEDGAASATLSQTIQGAPSTTSLSADMNPANFGQTITFTALVASSAGAPDGTLTFKNGSQTLTTVPVVGGQAQLAISTLAAGTHTIKASYNGSSVYGTSSGTAQEVVKPVATNTSVVSSLNPSPAGQSVTFSATVTSTAVALPVGNVAFLDGKKVLGTVALVNGEATFATSVLKSGSHTVTAAFRGSANYSASTSGPVPQVIE